MIIPYSVSELYTESCTDNWLSSMQSQDVIITSSLQHETMLFGMPCFSDVGAVILLSVINNKRHHCRYPFARGDTETLLGSSLASMLRFHLLLLCRFSLQISAHLQTFFITESRRTFTSQWLGYYFKPPIVLQHWFGDPLPDCGAVSWGVLCHGTLLWETLQVWKRRVVCGYINDCTYGDG